MAFNLFSKTYAAHQVEGSSSRNPPPSFIICEQDDARAEAFLEDLRNRAGAELARRIERVGNGKE